MSSVPDPYEKAEPGGLITAQLFNGLQTKIKQDIQNQIKTATEQIKKTGVERADNADKFDHRAPKDWTDELDKRYAQKVHDHEGVAGYRRYIKEFTPEINKVLLKHDLRRFPLVQVYELLPVTTKPDFTGCKLLFYYGHEDAEKFGLWVKVYRDRTPLGISFEKMLFELGVKYEDDDTIEDVLNDMWERLMHEPNDEIKHCVTGWIDECCGKRRTVADLKRTDQWDDLYVAIKPRTCGKGADGPTVQVEITQVNYENVLVEAKDLAAGATLDLMILLRS